VTSLETTLSRSASGKDTTKSQQYMVYCCIFSGGGTR